MCLCIGRYCHSDLRLRGSYYYYLLFFQNCKLVIYTILLLELGFCKGLYAFQLLSYLYWYWIAICRFSVLNADIYDLFYLLNRYFVADFNLFLYKYKIFYYKRSMFCDIYMLTAYRGPVYCYSWLTCVYGRLGFILDSGFVQLIRCSILII